MTIAPVFRSVSQALHVSFLMASLPVAQKGNTQVALERLMEEAGVRTEVIRDGTLNFSGLTSMEVRGQCAMVRGAVQHHCTAMERFAIWARFAHDASKAEGVSRLRDYCAGQFTVESPQAQMLMVWAVHATGRVRNMVSQRAIAAEHQLSQSTVQRNMQGVAKIAGTLRRAGMLRLQPMFERDDLVDAESMLEA